MQVYFDFLADKGRSYATSPSLPLENRYPIPGVRADAMAIGATMDNEIPWEWVNDFLDGSNILGDITNVKKPKLYLRKPRKPVIDQPGKTKEWIVEYTKTEPGHGHVSIRPLTQKANNPTHNPYSRPSRESAPKTEASCGRWGNRLVKSVYHRFLHKASHG